jgi:(p)ppGpp synthase/HD superfamily hydrolase
MHFTPRINEAIRLASRLHKNQTRHDVNHTPYISHLVAVAMILREITTDEDIIIAGLMHDSLEDVPDYTYESLVDDCGERVAKIVKHVSEPLDPNKNLDEQLPWLVRKEAYLNNLRGGTIESALVSAADKIHNTESFVIDYKREGSEFLRHFGSSILNTVWFIEQVLEIISEKLSHDHMYVVRLNNALDEMRLLANTRSAS